MTMARRTAKRSEWRRTTSGALTCSIGERGTRVRLFQKRSDGMFFRAVWRPGMGEDQKPLGTRERDEAIHLGRLLLAELLRGTAPVLPQSLTLGQLWRRYSIECAEHLDNKERTR